MANKQLTFFIVSRRYLFLGFFCSFFGYAGDVVSSDKPKMIVQITVDQLRPDLITRSLDKMERGGFRYFLENGAVFHDAHHPHANTETIVGHTTLATGAYPSIHGMVGNVWFDKETGFTTYNIEDPDYSLLKKGSGVDKKTEIDPTQRAARSSGRSPANILVTTVADELSAYTNGQAKVFGVSVKDRGAVSMAGHSGKAFWFSKSSGEFVTSSYYYSQYPKWVEEWNARKKAERYGNTSWNLLRPKAEYLYADSDDRFWETSLGAFGRVFPHPYGPADHKLFNTLLTLSPAGDSLTLDFVQSLLLSESLGKDDITDYLSVSFSSADYVGHIFGPSSLEAEDNILRVDRNIATLLKTIDNTVGLSNALLILSSDHGSSDTPGHLNSLGIPASYVDPGAWDKAPAIATIKTKFNIKGKLVDKFVNPYVYLSSDVVNNASIDQLALEAAVVKELQSFAGVELAVSSRALSEASIPDTMVHKAVKKNFHPRRSGDVYVVFKPHHFINTFSGLTVAATHGSPWNYDTHVPVMFAGHNVEQQNIYRRVHTVDIAPTLSRLMGMQAPSGSVGDVLSEVLSN